MKHGNSKKYTKSIDISSEDFEECALCHRLTTVRKNTPIECREHYVYGVGQLCMKCYHKTYCETK